MNLLSLELLKGLLNEDELPNTKKVIGMFGGGFKPPTSGHLEVVKRALQENPEMDLMLILVGSGTRNSISQEESIAVWNMYAKYLPSKVRVMASPDNKAPIAAIYSYGKKNPDKEIYWFIGAREGNEGDFQDIANRTKSLRKGDYPNIKVKEIVTTGAVSGTKARQALLTKDKETFTSFLPNIPEIDQIWDMLADVIDVNEDKTSILGKYDREELKKGIEVEKEHTNDPKIALKIALDHLDEDPEYYTKLATLGLEERISFKPEFTKDEIEFIEDEADNKMQPEIDIDLSGNHFFDRLNDPRNYPEIEPYEIDTFFDKLADKKEEFIQFLTKYKSLVAKDNQTNINIPFMKIANKAIAKTIMRKRDFKTSQSSPIFSLQEGYDSETTMQSRYIINQLKNSLGTYYEEETEGNLNGVEYTLEFKLNPVKPKDLENAPYLLDAAGGKDSIELVINYIPSSLPQSFNDLIAELKDTLRHELEHVGQENFKKGVRIGNVKNDNKLDLYKYLTLDYEIPAFIRGLNKKAKTKRIPLGQAIDEFFLERAEELSYGEEAYVKRKWMEWIKKNLPNTPLNENIEDDITSHINSLTDYMGSNGLNLKPHPSIEFIDDDRENAANIFGKTAYYMPSEQKIALYVLDRHPKDILRSYAHELVHHHQNLNNTLQPFQTQNTNEDGDLERIEREAYENGNILFRNWEDSIKNEN